MNRTANIAFQRRLFLAFVALLLGGGPGGRPASAQSGVDDRKLVVLSREKATRFIVQQPIPEYPTLARMNYIQFTGAN